MARGRFISNSISGSKKFARLTAHDHRLMYMMLVPHADAEGRHDADPQILAGQVYTRLDFTAAQIEAGLRDMHDVGLIRLYAVGEEQYLEIVGFHEHNKVRRKDDGSPDREAPSAIPAPPQTTVDTTPEALPTNSGVAPEEDESNSALRVKGKGLRVKGEERTLSIRDDVPDPAPVEAEPRLSLEPEPPPSTGKKPKPKPRKAVEHEFNPVVVAGELPPQFDPDRFLAFCGMRLKRGWPMTLEALKAFLRKHQKHPRAVLDEMFDNAIVGQWQDLYPLKHDRPAGSARASPARDLPTAADFEHVPTNAELLGLTGGEPN